MPGFFRKLFGLRPKSKPKVNVPSFKSAEEYSLWRNKTYGEPLPQKMLEAQEAARKKFNIYPLLSFPISLLARKYSSSPITS